MKKLKIIIYALLCLYIGTAKAQTALHSFVNGEFPTGSLILAGNNLYGMTPYGGNTHNDGQIFKYNVSTNTYSSIYTFSGSDGANPFGSLVLYGTMSNATVYGMTNSGGGTANDGVIFAYNLNSNTMTTIHTFTGASPSLYNSDGANPYGSLIKYATTGGEYLLGMTYAGGYYGFGMIFSCATTYPYTFTDLYDFGAGNAINPYGDLTLVENNGDAVVYGVASGGNLGIDGGIFSYDLVTGIYIELYDFTGSPSDGANPYGNVVYAATSGGTLYGMTSSGGTNGLGTIFSYNIPTNQETPIFNFYCTRSGCAGAAPLGSLVMAGDELFGMTASSLTGYGEIFSYNPYTLSYSSLGTFTGPNGATPYFGGLTLASDLLYGMTKNGGSGILGGSDTDGVIFELGNICDIAIDTNAYIYCASGSLSVIASFGTSPYTYSWSPGTQTNATDTGLSRGSYTVTVTDNNGCSASQSMVLLQPIPVTVSTDWDCILGVGSASASPSEGTPGYSYVWAPGGGTNFYLTGLTAGTYTVTVTDANGCTASAGAAPCLLPPPHHSSKHEENDSIAQLETNISLYPNPTNGQFMITGLESGMLIEVYDYTGRLISKTVSSNETMSFNMSGQANGVYLVRIMSPDGSLIKESKIVKTE